MVDVTLANASFLSVTRAHSICSTMIFTSLDILECVGSTLKDKSLTVGVFLADLLKTVGNVDGIVLLVRTVVKLGTDETLGQSDIARDRQL